ncbi:MAG: hypothetical protein WCK32_00630 [Chlorobiaceae bacterium]
MKACRYNNEYIVPPVSTLVRSRTAQLGIIMQLCHALCRGEAKQPAKAV